jgi:hypothetical protein
MSTETVEPGHGHSPAAWTSVTIMLVAVTIGTIAFFFEAVWVVWAAVVLLIIGLIVGWVLARAGYGVNGSKIQPREH